MKKEYVDIEVVQELILSFAEGNFSKRAELSPLRDDTDAIIAGINMLGEELESITVSRDYFLSIYNAISDFLIVVNNDGEIANVNDSVCQKLKLNRSELIGENIRFFFPREENLTPDIDWLKNEKSRDPFETFINGNNVTLPVRCSISKITDKNALHKGYVITASDISFEKEVEKEILNTIISTEEKEKTRIAYDLHDSLGQELNAIRMYLDVALKLKNDEEKFDSIITSCKQLVDDSIDSVRKIAKDLIPKALEDGELFSALNELSLSISKFLTIEKELPEVEFSLTTDTKVKIYRIIQEFFSNTLKHADASQLELSAGKNKNRYYFQISDNGKGFDRTKSKLGNGVKNIETRLKALDAQYTYTSKMNHGTILKFELGR